MRVGRWVIGGTCVALAYGLFCLGVWSVDFGGVDSAIAETLIITRAEAGYAELNGGFSEGNLECLERPGTCIPSQQSSWAGRAFISPPASDGQSSHRWVRPDRQFTGGLAVEPAHLAPRPCRPRVSVASAMWPTRLRAGRGGQC